MAFAFLKDIRILKIAANYVYLWLRDNLAQAYKTVLIVATRPVTRFYLCNNYHKQGCQIFLGTTYQNEKNIPK
jgi:hypothetical protein